MQQFDVAIVGLGALGSAAAWQASLKGSKVIGFEQFELGHVRGASHDTSRIVRTSYDAPEYVALAKAAYRDWAHLEKAAGIKLVTITGGVVFLPKDGATSAKDFTQSLDANNVPYELLNAQQVNKRWPQFNVGNNIDTVYTADTGIAHASKSVSAMQSMARAQGAVLKELTQVQRITPQPAGKGVILETSRGQFQASKVILASDAWTNKLLAPLGAEIPLTVMQEQVNYYKPSDPANFEDDKFPVWITIDEKNYYGFPSFGEPTIKAARDRSENLMTPEQRTYVHSPKLLNELTSFVDDLIPDAGRETLRTVTCQYAITPDREFIISPLKKHPDVIVALGAGHAFKFAPAIGRVAAELAIDGRTKEDITRFGIRDAAAPLQSKL